VYLLQDKGVLIAR